MNKKVLVVSHERSGTHWLIDTIVSNFLVDDPRRVPARIDLDLPEVMYCDPEEMKRALQFLPQGAPLDDIVLKHPFKSHHAFEFFEKIWDYVIEQYHVFYIARDGRDVMTSFWRHCWKVPGVGPRTFDVTQFLNSQPHPPLDRYMAKLTASIAERWSNHVVSWMAHDLKGVCYVKYEDMHRDFGAVVRKVASFMEVPEPERHYAPKLGGVTPWRGQAGSWKEFFGKHGEGWFRDYATPGMKLLGYYKEDSHAQET